MLPSGGQPKDKTLHQRMVRECMDAFFEAYAVTGVIQDGLEAAEVSRTTFHRWRDNDRDFAERFDEVTEAFNDKIRSHVVKRAFGYQKPLHFKGRLTGDTVEEYSERMLEKLAASRMPKEFRQNQGIEISESADMLTIREQFLDRLLAMTERMGEDESSSDGPESTKQLHEG